jgi:chromosome segregation protein
MYIQQLEIDNFKSFSGKTVVPFRRGFTTVSGPNGSGKSNIVDSILFALGLSTSRTMRAEKLTDLINNTSRRREASVTITFSQSTTELPEALLDGSFSEDESLKAQTLAALAHIKEGEPLVVARRVRETPSGTTSTYYLNNKPSSLGEVHEVLAYFNVSPGCYNVMMQGDVASIVTMSALERRKILDEVAGVADFDRKIDQAQGEMKNTAETLERQALLLAEIESRMAQLKEEREKALAYQALRQQLTQLEAQLERHKLLALLHSQHVVQQQVLQCQQQRKATQQHIKTLAAQIEASTEALLALNERITHEGEGKLLQLSQQQEQHKGAIQRHRDRQAWLQQQDEQAQQRLLQLEQDLANQEGWVATRQAELAVLAQQAAELEGLAAQAAKTQQQVTQQLAQSQSSGQQLLTQRQALRTQLQQWEDEAAQLQRAIAQVEGQQALALQAAEQQAQQHSSVQSRKQALKDRYNALSKQCEALEGERNQLETEGKTLGQERATLQGALKRCLDELNPARQELARLEARLSAYEEMSLSRPVEMVMKSKLPGVHGPLAQLLDVEAPYQLAIEMALGGRLQHVVVEDDGVAQQAIRLLQAQRGGRATFLPLNRIQGRAPQGQGPANVGVLGFAFNLVSFEPLYSTIMAFALGDTLIVEDLAAAKALTNKYRMVTLDGSVVEKSGAMAGGSTPNQRGGRSLFQNNQGAELELANLKSRLAGLEDDRLRTEKHLNKTEAQYQQHQQAWQQAHSAHQRLVLELQSLEEQLASMEAEATTATATANPFSHPAHKGNTPLSLEAYQALLAKDVATHEVELTENQARMATLQQEMAALDAQLNQAELTALQDELNEADFQLKQWESQLRGVQHEAKQYQLELDHRQGSMAERAAEKITLAQQRLGWEAEQTQANEAITEEEAALEALEEAMAEMSDALKSLQAERQASQNALIEEEKQRHAAQRSLQEAEERLIALQARNRELESHIATQKEALGEACPNAEALAEALVAFTSGEATATEASKEEALQRQAQSLAKKLQAMEPVNMLAIAEFDQVEGRQHELGEKLATLQAESSNLASRVEAYQAMKRTCFMACFDRVNEQFQSIYAELSDGYGQLVLTQAEDPLSGGLTIEASPRGKKTQRLEAMSGGEKSLTSLAFVFALQRTMPAPFYALDEVDQNLDGLNVEKLARMIFRESRAAQFVVVSLRKPMLEASDRTVGVTQKNNGISRVTGLQHRPESEVLAGLASSTPPKPQATPKKTPLTEEAAVLGA